MSFPVGGASSFAELRRSLLLKLSKLSSTSLLPSLVAGSLHFYDRPTLSSSTTAATTITTATTTIITREPPPPPPSTSTTGLFLLLSCRYRCCCRRRRLCLWLCVFLDFSTFSSSSYLSPL
ncbi:hypothetical protein M0802_000286 [Mischocyttarus mexicanus]|nr:hypothetical protein M0802_000286 [Mischocyttarus mexicanus]